MVTRVIDIDLFKILYDLLNNKWAEQDSNLRPPLCKRGALTN